MSILNGKPLFSLSIKASDVRAFIEVNGIYVHTVNSSSGSSSVEIPVNHYFHPETNYLGVVVFPLAEGEKRSAKSTVNLTLSVKSDENPNNKYDIAEIEYRASQDDPSGYNGSNSPVFLSSIDAFAEKDEGDVVVHPVVVDDSEGISISRKIEVPNSLPVWGFFESDDLPDYFRISKDDYARDKDALYEIYKVIEQSLSVGEVDEILDLFEERNRETDQAFYLDQGETRDSLKQSFLSSVNNENIQLLESDSIKFGLRPEPGRKLVRFIRADRRGAIAFNFIGEEGSVRYDLVFRKQDGEWIISR
ncbi:hypothetical protein OOT55_16205 [Marinimicrobium sp. C6131]|uniref:hypothetical protein n=1 Tax=Marinimicrobium sp. C6131 TaxID=3022676 RepID=UPI00223D3A25|nr:hypothetical protein [Marinimicrobium sp. C6131]UZJ44183.1 hypothetical protein OOT55_16205 [Marinimicrobium sp. C6131]